MPTIRDVASRAGVSVATVSRVLNDDGYYGEDAARRVREAVAALGYRRNVHWTRLKRNSSDTVCFLLGNRDVMNSMQMRMLVASERVFHERGVDLVFSSFHYAANARAAQVALPRILAEKGLVDGVILAGAHYGNLLEVFARLEMPYVLLGNTFTGGRRYLCENSVIYDDQAGCFEAASYLLRLGHRRIAFVGDAALPWFRRRREGYLAALRAHKVSPIVADRDWRVSSIEYGRLAAAELLRRAQPPTAILAANDEIAAGVWKDLVHRGVPIPQSISLIGFGDREEFQILEPSLTTVSVYPDNLGAELARMLLERLEHPGRRIAARQFPCQLVERASCGAPAGRLAVAGR